MPPEPPDPLETRLCPTCGKTCSTIGRLNKHIKEVHTDTTFHFRKCPRTYKTKSNRVKHEKKCVHSPRSPARKPASPPVRASIPLTRALLPITLARGRLN